jgi:hypothetical protein
MDKFGLIIPSNTQKLTGQKTFAQRMANNNKDDVNQNNYNTEPQNNNLSSLSSCSLCSICSIVMIYFIFKGIGIKT